jgi:hypothetical protein
MTVQSSPLETLHRTLAAATFRDLPAEKVYRRDHLAVSKLTRAERLECEKREKEIGHAAWPGAWSEFRPNVAQISVRAMFPQQWGSSALGFGGVGGQAMTEEYTTVLQGPGLDLAVYFGGSFAYLLPAPKSSADMTSKKRTAFQQDLANFSLADVITAVSRYGAIPG